MLNPKISVIMSVYNGDENYLRQAIESILSQTFHNFEFIIVNDSPDNQNVNDIINSYKDGRIKLIVNEKNIGLTKSLNVALNKSLGKYIARIDADDLSYKDRFQKQFDYLEKNPQTAVVGSWVDIIDNENKITRKLQLPSSPGLIKYELIFRKPPLFHSAIMFRKDIIISKGGYNNNVLYSQDFDLYLRLINDFDLSNIPEFLISYRAHSGSINQNKQKEQNQFYLKSLHEYIHENLLPISWDDFIMINDAKNKKVESLNDFKSILLIFSKLYKKFLKKFTPNPEEKNKIKKLNSKQKKLFLQWLVKKKLPKLYSLLKKFLSKILTSYQ